MSVSQDLVQYVPFISFVSPSFWHVLTETKIDIDKLNDATKQISGRFTIRDDIGAVFEVDSTSFNKTPEQEFSYVNVTGTIMNKNTIEDFKSIDKAALINSIGETIWANIKNKTWIKTPTELLNFFLLSYADLKKFHYYYWFAFPTPSRPAVYLKEKSTSISTHFSNRHLEDLAQIHQQLNEFQKPFFVVIKGDDKLTVKLLSEVFEESKHNDVGTDIEKSYFVFNDPSNGENPGWPLRLFLAALYDHCPVLASHDVKVIGLRCKTDGSLAPSRVFTLKLPQVEVSDSVGWVGWERNDKGNFGPRLANMAASMDPLILADTSSDLNLKLMKWRLVPEINIDIMKNTKCLLLGAGTLGCHVARDLLAWGFRHITFLDNGKVSYSNPTRQVLFNFHDCENGGRQKAEAAANNLKSILPTVKTKGIVAHIPMPGHPIGQSLMSETLEHIKTITEAIEQHDAIFLLLDTREARWLPTLIAAHYKKIVINAALGFDSYLVMRHGVGLTPPPTDVNSKFISGGQLGCYFCNDVTAPGNSLKDRTLDQQCTVTRPGVAAIAAAVAVEVLVALLQHPRRIDAPALYNSVDSEATDLQTVLGPVPHSVRGFLHSYQTMVPTSAKFKQCIACSDIVINKYRSEANDFLVNVFNSANYLEEITGLTDLHLAAEMADMVAFSDEEET